MPPPSFSCHQIFLSLLAFPSHPFFTPHLSPARRRTYLSVTRSDDAYTASSFFCPLLCFCHLCPPVANELLPSFSVVFCPPIDFRSRHFSAPSFFCPINPFTPAKCKSRWQKDEMGRKIGAADPDEDQREDVNRGLIRIKFHKPPVSCGAITPILRAFTEERSAARKQKLSPWCETVRN